MIAHYIHHSCFLWEGPRTIVVYDFWRDTAWGKLRNMLAQSHKQVYFVNSHFHEDHFNRSLLQWGRSLGAPPRLMLSHDIVKRRRIPKDLPIIVLRPDGRYEDEYIRMQVYRSTDVGISTYIELKDNGESCFHAGDLNNWYFPEGDERLHVQLHEMEGLYMSILRDLQLDHPHITHVMFPLDPRLEREMLRGPSQLLARIEVDHFYPMHTWGRDLKESVDELIYLFPHTTFHYRYDPHGEALYGAFLEVVRDQLVLAESGRLWNQTEIEKDDD